MSEKTEKKPSVAEKSATKRAAAARKAAQDKMKAEAAQKKARADAAKLAAQNAKWLNKQAVTIQAVIKRLTTAEGRADDQRAVLSVALAEAEEICKSSKISFRTWAEENIKRMDGTGPYSYPELRRLTKIGRAAGGDEAEARKLLTEMRAATAQRVKEHTERKKEENEANAEAAQKAAQEPSEASSSEGHNGGPPMQVAAHADPSGLVRVVSELAAQAQLNFLEQLGEALGLTITIAKSGRQVWPKD